MEPQNVLLVVVAIVGIFVVWIATGGPERAGENGGLFTQPEIGSIAPRAIREGTDVTTSREQIEQRIQEVRERIRGTESEIERLERIGTPSPHFGDITIQRRTSGLREELAAEEHLTIVAADTITAPITITGWQIESRESGYRITIGEGAALPRAGQVNSRGPIALAAGERAVIATGFSPIGVSFKTNTCTGYFDQFRRFTPSLNRQCPRPENEFRQFAPPELQREDRDRNNDDDPDCLDFIDGVPRCEVVLGSLEQVEPALSDQCKAFIREELTYEGCLANHRNDFGFGGAEWRVFLESNAQLWGDNRDVIRLLDHNGQTVDIFSY